MEEADRWLLQWFADRKHHTAGSPLERLTTDYFRAGLVDSFGVMELIGEIEEHFQLRFGDRDFQDRRFTTIGGLAQIIRELRSIGPNESARA